MAHAHSTGIHLERQLYHSPTYKVTLLLWLHTCACNCREAISHVRINAGMDHDMFLRRLSHSPAGQELQARLDNRTVAAHVCAACPW